jgi:hypothetical protein
LPSSTRKRAGARPLATAGVRLTARDQTLLASVWTYRELTRDQLQRLHFAGTAAGGARSPSICGRRLGLLRTHGFLLGRRIPTAQGSGATPYLYTLGPRAVPLLAVRLGLLVEQVRRRQRQDARLGWYFHDHRRLITDVQIALASACQTAGYGLTWQRDEELAALRETVQVEGGRVPIRPDAFFVVDRGTGQGRAACFLEVQLHSEPAQYRHKAVAYGAYHASGAYTARFGFHGLRVLAVADTAARVRNLHAAVHDLPDAARYWCTTHAALISDPFASIWTMGDRTGHHALLAPPPARN